MRWGRESRIGIARLGLLLLILVPLRAPGYPQCPIQVDPDECDQLYNPQQQQQKNSDCKQKCGQAQQACQQTEGACAGAEAGRQAANGGAQAGSSAASAASNGYSGAGGTQTPNANSMCNGADNANKAKNAGQPAKDALNKCKQAASKCETNSGKKAKSQAQQLGQQVGDEMAGHGQDAAQMQDKCDQSKNNENKMPSMQMPQMPQQQQQDPQQQYTNPDTSMLTNTGTDTGTSTSTGTNTISSVNFGESPDASKIGLDGANPSEITAKMPGDGSNINSPGAGGFGSGENMSGSNGGFGNGNGGNGGSMPGTYKSGSGGGGGIAAGSLKSPDGIAAADIKPEKDSNELNLGGGRSMLGLKGGSGSDDEGVGAPNKGAKGDDKGHGDRLPSNKNGSTASQGDGSQSLFDMVRNRYKNLRELGQI